MITGGLVWAYVIGCLCTVAASLDPNGQFYKNTMDQLNYMMADRELPQEMQRNLRMFWKQSQHVVRVRG